LSLTDVIHNVVTGSKSRRDLLTPVGLIVFGGSLLLVVVVGLLLDRLGNLPTLFPGVTGVAVGVPLLGIGSVVSGSCVLRFRKAAGTPVPINPPTELVVEGAYRWMRNPMLAGVFTGLFGVGVLLHSVGTAVICTPAYIVIHVLVLKFVEEPGLERRFGTAYSEYKREVPMFWPRFRRGVKRRVG